jgi:hypothetical protein
VALPYRHAQYQRISVINNDIPLKIQAEAKQRVVIQTLKALIELNLFAVRA